MRHMRGREQVRLGGSSLFLPDPPADPWWISPDSHNWGHTSAVTLVVDAVLLARQVVVVRPKDGHGQGGHGNASGLTRVGKEVVTRIPVQQPDGRTTYAELPVQVSALSFSAARLLGAAAGESERE